MNYWLGVVSKEHVLRGADGGFAQVCHGKRAPLAKMKKGDWLIYYSPKIAMVDHAPLQAFTAIGKIRAGDVYQVEMTPDFHPFRLDVEYFACEEVPLADVIHKLELTQIPNWGMQLRRGLLPISKKDFTILAAHMQVEIHE